MEIEHAQKARSNMGTLSSNKFERNDTMDEKIKNSEALTETINKLMEELSKAEPGSDKATALSQQIFTLTQAKNNAVLSEQPQETVKEKSKKEWLKALVPAAITGALALVAGVVQEIIRGNYSVEKTIIDCNMVKDCHNQAIKYSSTGETVEIITDPAAKDMMRERPGKYSR